MELTYLLTEAKALKGCSDGIEQLRACKSVDDLIECYFDRIDYCIANDFPTNDFLLKYRDELGIAGIFVDKRIKLHNSKKIVLLGSCDAQLTLTDWSTSRVYVKGNSKLHIKANDYSITMVDALDDSEIIVDEAKSACVIVNIYANAKCTGASRIIQKNKLTYDL